MKSLAESTSIRRQDDDRRPQCRLDTAMYPLTSERRAAGSGTSRISSYCQLAGTRAGACASASSPLVTHLLKQHPGGCRFCLMDLEPRPRPQLRFAKAPQKSL